MMLGFFSPTRRAKPKATPFRRLSVELLEARDCPSCLTMSAQVLPGQEVLLSGVVYGQNAAYATVDFSGAIAGSTTADANGNYSYTANDASLGTVSAVATDAQEDTLGTASASVTTPAPAVTLSLSYLPLTITTVSMVISPGGMLSAGGPAAPMILLTGTVSDVDEAGETVNFSGMVSGSAVTDANGNFSFTAPASGSGAIDVNVTDFWGQASNTAEVDVAPPPTVTLNAQVLPGHEVQLSGAVSGALPGGATVTFSGAVTGSTTTDANGNYTFTTTAASLGAVTAVAVDTQQNTSSPVSAAIATGTPSITLSATPTDENTMTFSGTVADVDQANETVNISGAYNGTVTTDQNGNFTFTMAANNLGTVDVSVTDEWGQTSNTAEVAANNMPPLITSFNAVQGSGNAWIIQGQVQAPNLQGLTINFGGIAPVNGQTTTTAADGSFYIVVTLNPNQYGVVSAQAVDQNAQTSEIALYTIV